LQKLGTLKKAERLGKLGEKKTIGTLKRAERLGEKTIMNYQL
jgi:hypothetical protein